jgi:hypothetical protein
VASSLNLEDICQREAPPIRCSNWHRRECDLLDPEGVSLMKGLVMVFEMRETILDNILGHDHVDLTIFYYPRDNSMVLIIWKWLLTQTIMEGFSLKEFLLSYNESYILEVDVEGMIGLKKKKYGFSKKKWKEIVFVNFISKIEKVLSEECYRQVWVFKLLPTFRFAK